MNIIEQFYDKIDNEYRRKNAEWLNMSQSALIDNAWGIAKFQSIYDYLCNFMEEDYGDDNPLYYADFDVISALCEYEMDYDTPQWINYDDIANMIEDFNKEKTK